MQLNPCTKSCASVVLHCSNADERWDIRKSCSGCICAVASVVFLYLLVIR